MPNVNVLKELNCRQTKSYPGTGLKDPGLQTAESRAQKSQYLRDECIRDTIAITRAASEHNIATARKRQRQQTSRSLTRASFFRLAIEYAPDINYSSHSKISIGAMDKVCQYYHALKFRNETPGMFC